MQEHMRQSASMADDRNAPDDPATSAMLEEVMAETIGMAMHNAVVRKRSSGSEVPDSAVPDSDGKAHKAEKRMPG